MTTPRLVPPNSAGAPAFPRELLPFFVQLSVSLGKSRSYPPGHPVLTAALEVLARHLSSILEGRSQFTIGVTRTTLVVDGVPGDDNHPVLRDLAERLHHHQLAALQFRPGIPIEELASLVVALSSETWRQGKPLGLEPLEQLLSRWPHVSLEPLPLDQLELGEEVPGSRQADRIWQGLLNAALLFAQEGSGGTPGSRTEPPSATDIAAAIRARRGDAAYDRAVVEWLMQVGEQLGEAQEGSPLHQKVAELFGALDEQTLENVIRLGATPEQRRRMLLRGSRGLPVRAVLDLLHAASNTPETNPSHSLMRILGKLASHVEPRQGPVVVGAEEALRDSVAQLVGDWDLEVPSSHQHRQLLDLLARPGGRAGGGATGKATPSDMRLLQLGLELGVSTPGFETAAIAVADSADIAALMGLMDQAEAAGLDPAPLWNAMVRPAFLLKAMLEPKTDLTQLERILDRLGAGAVEPLLDALEAADSASRRRWLMGRLDVFGEGIGPLLVQRLPDKPWYVVRNLLTLLQALPRLPDGFEPSSFAEHEDPRVRREALKLQLGNARWRSAAIVKAVGDPDQAIVRLALAAAAEDCPAELPPRLFELLRDRIRDPQDRVLAIRLLGKRPTPVIRDWLLAQVASERRFLWLVWSRLHGKSPEMLAALGVLAARFGHHPDVTRALRLAQQSNDAEVRLAASGGSAP